MSVNLAGLSVPNLHDQVPMSLALHAVNGNANCRKNTTFHHASTARLWLDRFSPQIAVLEVPMDDDGCYELVFIIKKRVPVVIYSEDGHSPEQSCTTALRDHAGMSKKANPHHSSRPQSAFATMQTSAGDDAAFDQDGKSIRETPGHG
jgi:hypothetical protein